MSEKLDTSKAVGKTTAPTAKKEKRIGVCLECGYEWEARNPNLPRPPRCSQCGNKTNTAWKDKLSEDELQEISPKLHGLEEKRIVTTAKENTPINSTAEMKPDTLKENEQTLTENAESPKEVYISELDETVPLIENPELFEETNEEKLLSYVAWENKAGELEYGAVVCKEIAEQAAAILSNIENPDAPEPQPISTVKDIEILKAAGLLNENGTVPYSTDDDFETNEEIEPEEKTEENSLSENDDETDIDDQKPEQIPACKEKNPTISITAACSILFALFIFVYQTYKSAGVAKNTKKSADAATVSAVNKTKKPETTPSEIMLRNIAVNAHTKTI